MKRFQRILAAMLALCLLAGMLPGAAFALTMGTKPGDGTTSGEPFPKGTGGSNSFRIPALVTLSNGTLVAAADARWNTTYDGGGLDNIVARSTDQGANWSYTFANYLGDNGNTYNGSNSTAFIDPALAVTKDDTIYMLVDLYPYGVALNGSGNSSPVTATGFIDDNKLKLSSNSYASYDYYLNLTDYKIYKYSDNSEVTGYTVDKYFNITGTDGTSSNLFFSDSPYKVVRTGFLYLTTSKDQGETWSTPKLLNLKTDSEMVCLVAPGRGLVTEDGTIIFPVYSFHGDNNASGNTQRMSFIYSSDGVSWQRTAELNYNWASESAAVELTDGTLRFFFRNGSKTLTYVDYDRNSNTWGTPKSTGVANNSNTQLSAITYSGTIDGKQVILVSCPAGNSTSGSNSSSGSERTYGKIFAFTVEEDKTLTRVGTISVSSDSGNGNQFMYSCLTELKDGSVGLLFEDGEYNWGYGANSYYTMSYATYDLTKDMGLTFDAPPAPGIYNANKELTDVETMLVGASRSLSFEGLEEGQSLTAGGHDTGIVTVSVSGSTITLNPVAVGETTITFTVTAQTRAVGNTYTLKVIVEDITGEDKVESNGQSGNGGIAYVLDTDGIIDPDVPYLIVNTSANGTGYALTNNDGTAGKTAVTINNGVISLEDDTKISFSLTGNNDTLVSNGEYNIYVANTYVAFYDGYSYRHNVSHVNNGEYRIYRDSWTGTRNYLYYNGNSWVGTNSTASNTVYLYAQTTVGGEAWTVDAERQRNRIAAYTVTNDGYTDASWDAYNAALTAAKEKLAEVDGKSYAGEDAANAALAELVAAVDALEAAKKALVKAVTITIHYQSNGTTIKTETVTVTEADTSYALPTVVSDGKGTSYSVNYSALTLIDGAASYTVPVTELEGTPLSVKENELANISVPLDDGQYVQWSTSDANFAGVAGKFDPDTETFTNEAAVAGQQATEAPVLVTGTVYNSDGTVASVHKWLVTVTEGDADTNTSSKHIYVNIKTIENCTVYYSINGGPLKEVTGEGILIDQDVVGKYNFMAFATPNEGYALSYMSVAGSGNQYYTLTNGNPDGTGSGAWPFVNASQTVIPSASDSSDWKVDENGNRHGFRWPLLEGNMTIEQMKLLFSSAIALGADGVVSFTKNGSASFYTEMQFVAQKLATMEKEIVSIGHADGTSTTYTEGMEIGIGDTIHYKITITDPAIPRGDILQTGNFSGASPITDSNKPSYATGDYGQIVYSDVALTDKLTGNQFYDSNGNAYTLNMSASQSTEQKYELYTSIQLNATNFLSVVSDGKIINEAELNYKYSSEYTNGVLGTKADAVAEVLVQVPEYVIDFGLPIEIDLTNDPLVTGDKIMKATAIYGTVAITDERKIVYTPTQILQGPEFITLTFADGGNETAIIGYGVRVYPATTVYYEEGFASYTGAWSGTTSATDTTYTTRQQSAEVGQNNVFQYGYDDVYAGQAAGPSGGTDAVSEAKGNAVNFTFTGTGVEVYANCTTGTGLINVLIRNSAGQYVRFYQVDTVTGGASPITTPQTQLTNAFSLPVVSVLGLDHDTYTVTITHAVRNLNQAAGQVKIDGFRVHGTMDPSSVAYVKDGEAGPFFIELRNELLTVIQTPNRCESMYETAQGIVDQVFQTSDNLSGAVYLGKANDAWTEDAIRDLLDNGPKNEIYLYGQKDTLAFTIPIGVNNVQLGLKTVSGQTSYSIAVNGTEIVSSKTLTTSTDMFYTLTLEPNTANVVTITNEGVSILSVTKLKCLSDQVTGLEELTADHLVLALSAMGVQEVVEPESPFTDVQEGKYYYDAVLWAVENGITQGTSETTFEPDTICTRGQIVTFLWRMAGSPEPASLESPFVDVNVNNRFIKAIMWAVERGITKGTGDGTTFEPDKECTRGQIVMFLWRYYGSPEPESLENPFTDVSEHNTFFKPILWAYYEDITKGKTQTTFDSGDPCTRGQAVTFLYRSRVEE